MSRSIYRKVFTRRRGEIAQRHQAVAASSSVPALLTQAASLAVFFVEGIELDACKSTNRRTVAVRAAFSRRKKRVRRFVAEKV